MACPNFGECTARVKLELIDFKYLPLLVHAVIECPPKECLAAFLLPVASVLFCYKKKYKDLLGLVAFAFFSIDNTDQKNDQYWKERATRIKEKEICLAYSPKRKYRNPRYNIFFIKFTGTANLGYTAQGKQVI